MFLHALLLKRRSMYEIVKMKKIFWLNWNSPQAIFICPTVIACMALLFLTVFFLFFRASNRQRQHHLLEFQHFGRWWKYTRTFACILISRSFCCSTVVCYMIANISFGRHLFGVLDIPSFVLSMRVVCRFMLIAQIELEHFVPTAILRTAILCAFVLLCFCANYAPIEWVF